MLRRTLTIIAAALVLASTGGCAVVARSSQPLAPVEAATGADLEHAMSRDGRYVAFASAASNLVSGDNNNMSDIFVHDRVARSTVRVSVGSGAVQANGDSSAPALSEDGRYVAFASNASNLVVGDTNSAAD